VLQIKITILFLEIRGFFHVIIFHANLLKGARCNERHRRQNKGKEVLFFVHAYNKFKLKFGYSKPPA
jgi:hypothetical protein